MTFQQWQQVLDGTKTETRRIVRPNEYGWIKGHRTDAEGLPHPRYSEVCIASAGANRLKWAVGRTYAVQPKRGAKSRGRMRLLSIEREPVNEITDEGAIAEGCHDVIDYIDLWDSINKAPGDGWEDNPSVWVLGFEPVKAGI